jgi:hypothetical protein
LYHHPSKVKVWMFRLLAIFMGTRRCSVNSAMKHAEHYLQSMKSYRKVTGVQAVLLSSGYNDDGGMLLCCCLKAKLTAVVASVWVSLCKQLACSKSLETPTEHKSMTCTCTRSFDHTHCMLSLMCVLCVANKFSCWHCTCLVGS